MYIILTITSFKDLKPTKTEFDSRSGCVLLAMLSITVLLERVRYISVISVAVKKSQRTCVCVILPAYMCACEYIYIRICRQIQKQQWCVSSENVNVKRSETWLWSRTSKKKKRAVLALKDKLSKYTWNSSMSFSTFKNWNCNFKVLPCICPVSKPYIVSRIRRLTYFLLEAPNNTFNVWKFNTGGGYILLNKGHWFITTSHVLVVLEMSALQRHCS